MYLYIYIYTIGSCGLWEARAWIALQARRVVPEEVRAPSNIGKLTHLRHARLEKRVNPMLVSVHPVRVRVNPSPASRAGSTLLPMFNLICGPFVT